jgi:C1A family cysteine protease
MYSMYGKLELKRSGRPVGTGWLPPMPDLRDYSTKHIEIREMAEKLGVSDENISLPGAVDLRRWCSPIEDQLTLGSCTAHAAVGLVEYFEIKAHNKHIDGSRLFVYKVTRNLMKASGDTGAWLRNVMGALCLCGVPDEKYWPYDVTAFDNEPPAFVYSVSDDFKALKYFCHDPQSAGLCGENVLASVKKYLAAGIPSMFGFWGFASFEDTDVKGGIPYPCPDEQAEWGHAIMAAGYDDGKIIRNTKSNAETTGALLIRNSWGTEWGDNGYGWLPYDYVLNNLASDFWSLLKMDWVDTKQFGLE